MENGREIRLRATASTKIPAEFGLKALANRETSGYYPA
jgi:hypothetical protein